jgi:hypothetical protein
MFEDVDKEMKGGKAIRVEGVAENGDAFHDQLVFCLGGESKYSSKLLCD